MTDKEDHKDNLEEIINKTDNGSIIKMAKNLEIT